MSLLKYAALPVLPDSASNRGLHSASSGSGPKPKSHLFDSSLSPSLCSVCLPACWFYLSKCGSQSFMTGSATMVHPTIVFPLGYHGGPRPQLLEFAEQLERAFSRISPLHGILFRGSRLLTLFREVLCFLTPADLSISFPISFLLFNFPDLLVDPELGAHSCLRDFIIYCSCRLEKHCSDLCRSVPLCQYVFCSDVISLAAVPQPPYLSSIFLHL